MPSKALLKLFYEYNMTVLKSNFFRSENRLISHLPKTRQNFFALEFYVRILDQTGEIRRNNVYYDFLHHVEKEI